MNQNSELSKNEKNILEFISEQVKKIGYPPSVREICKAVGLKSTSSVHMYLARLKDKGYIAKQDLKTRALKVMGEDLNSSDDTNLISIPLVGQVAAGIPILAEENIEEYVKIPTNLLKNNIKNETTYMLKVKGESMINAGIFDGDYIIVSKCQTAENGQIVVALIDDEATVKTFYKEKDHIRLQPENDSMEPIILKDVKIIGKLVGLIRKF